MATITLEGNEIHTSGELPAVGSQAPDFRLVNGDLKDVRLSDYAGKQVIMDIVVSLDTSICVDSARIFGERTAGRDDVVVLVISADLPFAQGRACSAAGAANMIPLSIMRNSDFARDYGVLITDGPLEGLAARSVVVVDASGKVSYTQLVPEIASEPDFDAALAALDSRDN